MEKINKMVRELILNSGTTCELVKDNNDYLFVELAECNVPNESFWSQVFPHLIGENLNCEAEFLMVTKIKGFLGFTKSTKVSREKIGIINLSHTFIKKNVISLAITSDELVRLMKTNPSWESGRFNFIASSRTHVISLPIGNCISLKIQKK
ncbi:MAG: hypothetical protein ACOYMB_01035 [Patescibacteria group bacterium]